MAPIFPSMLGSRLSSLAAGLAAGESRSAAERLKINIRSRASLGVRISRAARAKRGARGFSPGGETRQRTGETRETSAMPGLGAVPARGTVRREPCGSGSSRRTPSGRARRFFLSTRTRERSSRRDDARLRAPPRASNPAIGRADAFPFPLSVSARALRPTRRLSRARSHGREGFEWHERACRAASARPRRGGGRSRPARAAALRLGRDAAPEGAPPTPAPASRHLRRPARGDVRRER